MVLIILYFNQKTSNNIMQQKNWIKNSACVCFGLFFVSLSSFIMVQIYFQDKIDSQIQNISLLKDIRYPSWGKNPNPSNSQFRQTFSLYNLQEVDNQIHATQSNFSNAFQYHYQYQNTSFAQGNSGRLNFINKWQLKQINKHPPTQQNIKTINLAADKIFNYDYYAPPQKKFVLFYNYIMNSIAGPFLQKFYTVYLHKFFFNQKQLVLETVFKPLGFDTTTANKIYQDPNFGWSTPQTFSAWVRISLKGQQFAVRTPEYEHFATQLNLTQKQLSSLLFQKSTIQNMIYALNGTIKSKLMYTKGFAYKKCKQYCSNQQLAAFQIANSFLTGSDPLFSSLNLNMTTKQFNSTFFSDIQYANFCQKNKGKFNCISQTNMAEFFTQHYLGDFQAMDFIWKNKENYQYIEQVFHLQANGGQSIVAYIFNLYENYVKLYQQQFSWAQNNYNQIQNSVSAYKQLFLVQLYSRAFWNKFLSKKEFKCQDYFVGQFADLRDVACQIQETDSWNLVAYESVLRNYVKAYFFIHNMRDKMAGKFSISYFKIIGFFKDENNSLFAKQLKQIQSIFKQNFGCIKNRFQICNPQLLFCLQWGSNKILQNLPTEIFSNKIKNINQWDTKNVLNGLNPNYQSIIGKNKTVQECENILSSNTKDGVYSFLNLLRLSKQATGNPQVKNLLKYVGKNVMQIFYRGVTKTQELKELLNGFQSQKIKQKQQMNVSVGGAPWLQNQIKLIKTDNKAQIKNNQLLQVPQYDTIDTGIYNQTRTRQITKIWGETTSSSKYTVYRGTKIDDEGQEIPVDIFYKYVTDRRVQGTNLLGFHPFIQQSQNLKSFIYQAYQAMNLEFFQQVSYKSEQLDYQITANKYKILSSKQQKNPYLFIGIEQLNQNYFQLSPNSYAIVQPTTGLTLQLRLIYTIKSKPIYTRFLLTQTAEPISLFNSEIYYKRNGLSEIDQVRTVQQDKRVYTLVAVILAICSLVLAVSLTSAYWVMRRKNKFMKKTLLQSQVQTGEV